jgi:hypothetical protein
MTSHLIMSPRRGFDTKTGWLTDRQLQSDLDLGFKGLKVMFEK